MLTIIIQNMSENSQSEIIPYSLNAGFSCFFFFISNCHRTSNYEEGRIWIIYSV